MPKTKRQKTIKSISNKAKKTQKSVKTVQQTAQQVVKRLKQSAAMAKKATIAIAKTIKLTVHTIVTAVKATIAAIEALIAAIAAGGWVAIVIIIVVALIAMIAASPWGMFFDDMNDTTPTISEVITTINDEFQTEITSIIQNANDIDEVIIDADSSTDELNVSNWIDVLGVYAVKTTNHATQSMDVLVMDDERIELLRKVFWEMNIISYEVDEEIIDPPEPTGTPSPNASPTPTPEPDVYRTLMISIESLTYEQGAEKYNFNHKQNKLLAELMSAEYYPLFMEVCAMNTFNGLTKEQAMQLINDLPANEKGSEIVQYALSRLGDPYSQEKRGQGSYVDCSYLTRWCYQQAGLSSFKAPTAASQAEYCVNNGLIVAKEDLQPGDLIFWSFNTNARFMDITHVGIYAGNGMVIDASSSRGMVVYRAVFGEGNIVCYGRP